MTGSASGIGKAVVAACESRGDGVITVDRAAAQVQCDLATPAGRRSAVDQIIAITSGSIDGVVACAGLSEGAPSAILGVNFFGSTEIVNALRPMLAKSQLGRAVIISSEALVLDRHQAIVDACLAGDEAGAAIAAADAPGLTYQSSKRAVSLWVKREAVKSEWAGTGILLNAVAPGVTVTPMIQSLLDTKEGMEFLNNAVPMRLGRPAAPRELATLIAFLAGADNSFIVGQTIFCDGGAEATLRPDHV